MSTAVNVTGADAPFVQVHSLPPATLEAPADARRAAKDPQDDTPKPNKSSVSSSPDDTKHGHTVDEKAYYDDDGYYVIKAESPAAWRQERESVFLESGKAVAAMQLGRAMHFYDITLPLESQFKDLEMGDEEVAIHEDEKAIVFMNFIRHKPGFATLYDLC